MSPEILPDDTAALRALVLAAQAERDAERVEKARLIEERDQLAGQNDRLRGAHIAFGTRQSRALGAESGGKVRAWSRF